MLKKVFAVFPVFIFFAFSGLFVFASSSSPVFFQSEPVSSVQLTAEKRREINQLWSGIRNKIKNSNYYFLTKVPIKIPALVGKLYVLGPLYKTAQTELATSGSSLTTEGAREKLLELVDAGLDSARVNSALSHEEEFGFVTHLRKLWIFFIQELVKPKHAHLTKNPFSIKKKGEEVYKGSLEPLFNAARNQAGDSWNKLPTSAKDLLVSLVAAQAWNVYLIPALANTVLDLLWSEIKSELKTKYSHLSKTLIKIDETDYDLEPLFAAAKDDTQYAKEGSELPAQAKDKLQELVNAVVIPQKLKDALDVKNNEKLDAFWSEIKSELKKPDYAYLVKTPILVNGNNYNLEPLFVAVKNEYGVLGSQLSDSAKNKLQSLVSAGIDHQVFKTSLTKANNQKLDHLWNQLKKVFNQPEFSKWKDTSIKIKNKIYDLKLLFTAKDKVTVKGSALPLDTKLKLQKLLNDQVTSKMVENQLLALNQVEAEKNKQAKEKQQSQDLTIGLATGGSVLVAAGLGGFLYWFFKIRK